MGEGPTGAGRTRLMLALLAAALIAVVSVAMWGRFGPEGATGPGGVPEATVPEPETGTGGTETAVAPETDTESDPKADAAADTGAVPEPDVAADPGAETAAGAGAGPGFDVVRVEPDGSAVVAGRAAPGSKVTIYAGDVPLARVEADAAGNFVAVFKAEPSAEPRALTLGAETPDGRKSMSDEVMMLLPEPPAATVAGATPDAGRVALDVRPPAGDAPGTERAGGGGPAPSEDDVRPPPGGDAPGAQVAAGSGAAEPDMRPPDGGAREAETAAGEGPTPAGEDVRRPPGGDAPGAQVAGSGGPPADGMPALRAPAPEAGADRAPSEREGEPDTVAEAGPGGVPEVAAAAILRGDSVEVAPAEEGAGPGDRQVTLVSISYAEEGKVTLAGSGDAGALLRAYVDGKLTEEATVGSDGRWRLQLGEVAAGLYTLRIDQLGPDGRVESRVETPFQRDTPEAPPRQPGQPAPPPRPGAVTVQPGNNLWTLARQHYGSGVLYTQIFTANRQLIRDPDLIYPGQIFSLPEPEARE